MLAHYLLFPPLSTTARAASFPIYTTFSPLLQQPCHSSTTIYSPVIFFNKPCKSTLSSTTLQSPYLPTTTHAAPLPVHYNPEAHHHIHYTSFIYSVQPRAASLSTAPLVTCPLNPYNSWRH